MPPPVTIDHLEKTLADSYRKEIDQEENVWRSLPFFAAALALQIAALSQVDTGWRTAEGVARAALLASGILVLFATIAAIACLAVSIFWARFRYIASEPDLLAYAQGLEQDAVAAADRGEQFDALATFKWTLAEQYAEATDNNRRINQRRARYRGLAGLAILVSILATLTLAVSPRIPYIIEMVRHLFGRV